MKKLKIISFTAQGSCLNLELNKKLSKLGYSCESCAVERFAQEYGLQPLECGIQEWVGSHWGRCSFVFVGAVGIAVRSIAPWIGDKFTDSAVLSVDEKGQFVIPVLSGHVGGAVELSRIVAECIGAVPAITTATDVQEKFAVDVFAKKNGLYITDRVTAKEISAAVLEGKNIGLYSELPLDGELPENLKLCADRQALKNCLYGIVIGKQDHLPEKAIKTRILYLVPKDIVIGIGCRKEISYETLKNGVKKVLAENKINKTQIAAFVSIDLKKDEKSLLELSKMWSVPFFTYTAEELKTVEQVSCSSDFVRQVTGVDNVCERVAVYHCREELSGNKGNWKLIQPKICLPDMTASLVKKEMEIQF